VIDLKDYLDPRNLAAAQLLGPAIRYERGRLSFRSTFTAIDGPALVQLRCLDEYLRSPVVVRPPSALCRALANTDLPLTLDEYRQPWTVLGIEWPEGIAPSRTLTLLWRPDPERIWLFTPTPPPESQFLHLYIAGPATLDGYLADTPLTDLTDAEVATSRHIARMALNLGLLLTHKGHRLTRLPEHVIRNRRHRDPATRQQARRQAQLVLFRDLDMFLEWEAKRPSASTLAGGTTFPPQFRRGHWKRVAHGPGFSLRKLDWIEPYWTGDPSERRPVLSLVS